MKTIGFEIEGVAPLRFNNFGATSKAKWQSGQGSGRPPTDDELEASWKEKLFEDEHGLYVPSKWVKASLRNAGGLLRVGRRSLYDWIKAVIFLEEDKLYLGKKQPDAIHEDIVRRPPKKGSIQRDRWPILNTGWQIRGKFLVTDDTFPISALEDALKLAGLRMGLGDGRPDFGRFRVVSFNGKAEVSASKDAASH